MNSPDAVEKPNPSYATSERRKAFPPEQIVFRDGGLLRADLKTYFCEFRIGLQTESDKSARGCCWGGGGVRSGDVCTDTMKRS